jgi:hypothetical protein
MRAARIWRPETMLLITTIYMILERSPPWRRDEREPRTDISQVELQLHRLRDAPRRGLHQLRREDRHAHPPVRPARTRRCAVLGRLPRGDRALLLHTARALARATSMLGKRLADTRVRLDGKGPAHLLGLNRGPLNDVHRAINGVGFMPRLRY